MRNVVSKFVALTILVIGAAGAIVSPALADGGGSRFEAGDGRYNPLTGDRVAVYCTDSGIEVWGLDAELNGQYLTTFSVREVASGGAISHTVNTGTVSLTMVAPAEITEGYLNYEATEIISEVEDSATYTVSWVDRTYGADGSAAYSKTLDCTYLVE